VPGLAAVPNMIIFKSGNRIEALYVDGNEEQVQGI
jgi:hypothetical protein